jgi:hypothetical protein
MNVIITLTNPGTDTGPFNIYTNVDNYAVPIATSVPRATLVGAGYIAIVDGNAATIKVQSTGTCTSSIFLPIIQPTTTTTTSTAAPTTTTTTTSGPAPTTTTSTTATPTTTTTTTSPPGPTTTTTTTPAPNFKFYFQVRNQTDTVYGNGTFFLNATGGSNTFTTDYSLIRSGISQFNPSGSSFVSESGYVIDKIVRYNYNGTEAYSLLVGTPNYTFGTGPFTMDSIGVADGFYQTIKVFTRPA